ncbi:response regulator [Dyella acidiphila]|uniref:Response regulator n=1 Tax=Dyella acidiphila TaxID=2775866 RepID=A0ABR9G6K7_9GAMM|nr:response regulator [Dyella acidiphila]MBE1159682.1 response regulator [Dyella acidiphila]
MLNARLALVPPVHNAVIRRINHRRRDPGCRDGMDSGMHVLIVDNDRDSSDLVSHALSGAGYEVFQARCVADALRLSRLHPDIDCVLADMRLDHQVSGVEIAGRMRPRLRNSHFIVASGDWDALDGACAHDLSVLRKPYGKTELLRAVRHGISRQLIRHALLTHRRPRASGALLA